MKIISSGRCEACNKELDYSDMRSRGFVTKQELNLCNYCASFVKELTFGIKKDEDTRTIEYTEEEYQQALTEFFSKQSNKEIDLS